MTKGLHHALRALTALATAALLTLGGASGATASIPPHFRLGGLDLLEYCRSQGDQSAVLHGATAYDWSCVDDSGGRHPLSFTAACRSQYTGLSVDRIEDFHDPTSVSCWRVASTDYFSPDLDAYCTNAQDRPGARQTGRTVYDWWCAAPEEGGSLQPIQMPAVCDWASGGYHAFDRFDDFYRADSWRCHL
ncbi:hypothetical protein [Streptomyces sp. NPDC006879]|uniref:hypothetical protein n=1 Tax=Streptomyces sp. NPDC006879 TaxID=3364767 RepID=UPI0036D15598